MGRRASDDARETNYLWQTMWIHHPSEQGSAAARRDWGMKEDRGTNRSRRRQGDREAVLVAGLLPLLFLIRVILKKEKNPPNGGILGHGPGVTCRSSLNFSFCIKTPWASLRPRDRIASRSGGRLPSLLLSIFNIKAVFFPRWCVHRATKRWKQDVFTVSPLAPSQW